VGAAVEKMRIADLRIAPCDACEACQSARDAPCAIEDDMAPVYAKLLAADALVFASPIYFFGACAQVKCLLDRAYALGGGGDWTALQGKNVGLLFTYGDHDPLRSGVVNAYGMFRDACDFLGMTLVGCVHACCGDAGEVLRNADALRRAEDLGRKLGAS
jgi:multimeric flavodoxin WrbA